MVLRFIATLILVLIIHPRSRWRFIHNVFVHPLMGFFGERVWIMRLHDWTGGKW